MQANDLDLRDASVLYQHAQPGYLLIQGKDQDAFLQRQTTNDMGKLGPGQSLVSVLTSPTARILDVFTLFYETGADGGRSIAVLTLPERGAKSRLHLGNRIFFMDQVNIQDVSEQYDQLDLEGVNAAQCLQKAGMQAPQEYQVSRFPLENDQVVVISRPGFTGTGYRLVAPKSSTAILTSRLQSAGVSLLDPQSYESLRVESGYPSGHHELTDAFTPLEMHLEYAISTTKGCYTGQEIIARQINYDKITRRLVGLTLDAPIQEGTTMRVEHAPAGVVTSSVTSPRFGPIALAVIRRPYDEPGTLLSGDSPDPVRARVTKLPFF